MITYNSQTFESELKPLVPLKRRLSIDEKVVSDNATTSPLVTWTVGGSFTVNETFLYGKWGNVPAKFDGIGKLRTGQIRRALESVDFLTTPIQSGLTNWARNNNGIGVEQTFEAQLDLSSYPIGTKIAVFAIAKVDQNWGTKPNNVWPDVYPQAHIANGRTNKIYKMKKFNSKGQIKRIVKSRLFWISVPLTIINIVDSMICKQVSKKHLIYSV